MKNTLNNVSTKMELLRQKIGKMNQTNSLLDNDVDYDDPVKINKIRQNKDLSKYGIYKRFENVTIDNILDAGLPSQCKTQADVICKYIKNINNNIKAGRGLLLKGEVGTMKTTFAIAVMRAAIATGYSAYFIPMVSLVDKLFSLRSNSERYEFERKIRETTMLVLDDLGAEISQDWIISKIDAIVTERHNRVLPTIITTNLLNKDFNNRYNVRTLDRLRTSCIVLTFKGRSLR